MQRNRWLALGVAADLPVNALVITDIKHSRVVRLNGRKPLRHDDHRRAAQTLQGGWRGSSAWR